MSKTGKKMNKSAIASILLLAASTMAAQQQPSSQPPLPPGYNRPQQQTQQQPAQPAPGTPQSSAPVRFLGPPASIYDPVQQAAQASAGDLSKLRIGKWKTNTGGQ